MEEIFRGIDLDLLVEAASDIAHYPGQHSDETVKEFLDRYPLQTLFSALEMVDEDGKEETLVSCLEKIFRTKFGASLIAGHMPYVRAGLLAKSETVNCLACRAVSSHLEKGNQDREIAVQLIAEHDIFPLLMNLLLEGNELVAAAALDAIKYLAQSQVGISIIFPQNRDELLHLKSLTAQCSSLARVRVLALLVKLFSLSISVATLVNSLHLLSLFEEEISNTDDMLTTLSALELLYELAASPHSSRFLLKTTLLRLLASIISNPAVEPSLRSRAVSITGRVLSQSDSFSFVEEQSIEASIRAIDGRLESLEALHTDECECALEALGQIGSSVHGAELLLRSPNPAARHVIASAFKNHERGKQLAALHAFAIICGIDRPDDQKLLKNEAEECLRGLIYDVATNTTKHTPSGMVLALLRQETEIRLAAYRLTTALAARPWFLFDICSKMDIINIVTDPYAETSKNSMEARHQCCTAISNYLSSSDRFKEPTFATAIEKLQEAVRRGPYLAKRQHIEAKPIVVTAERF